MDTHTTWQSFVARHHYPCSNLIFQNSLVNSNFSSSHFIWTQPASGLEEKFRLLSDQSHSILSIGAYISGIMRYTGIPFLMFLNSIECWSSFCFLPCIHFNFGFMKNNLVIQRLSLMSLVELKLLLLNRWIWNWIWICWNELKIEWRKIMKMNWIEKKWMWWRFGWVSGDDDGEHGV